MDLVGYADRMSVHAGEPIRFMVSCARPSFRADLVRLIHGSERAGGPGFKEREVASALSGDYPGRVQPIHTGSYVAVPDAEPLRQGGAVSVGCWVFPTLPARGREQAIVAKWRGEAGHGFALLLDGEGRATFRVAGDGGAAEVRAEAPLRVRTWCRLDASYDPDGGVVALRQAPAVAWPDDPTPGRWEHPAGAIDWRCDAPLVIAGWSRDGGTEPPSIDALFNGKIDSPALYARASAGEWGDPLAPLPEPLAAWDFAADHAALDVPDLGPHGLAGRVVNAPTRAVTGLNWDGAESNARYAPEQYAAIHFHEDDLDDCRWEVDAALTIPPDLPSGIYAARLRAGDAEEYVPFVVRPRAGQATATVAFLLSTNTYLSYANEQGTANEDAPKLRLPHANPAADDRALAYQRANNLLSQYDYHADGSGVSLSSRLRPILNMRPKARARHIDDPHAFPADLCLVDWLDHEGIACDVFTDEDLHLDGGALLAPYKVVLSGSHPEYWSGTMLDALEGYLRAGGRHLYLGGNGYYWVTSFCPHRPHLIEVRRWGGTNAWRAEPGEYHHATTGELGGLWRNRGRAPQNLVGVGFTAQGFDTALPYVRQPDSFDPEVAWIFDGVGADEPIGDGPNLILGHGAAGHEVDRFDHRFGTPPHAKLLATATGFSDSYQAVVEELLMSDSMQGGTVNPRVRADLTYVAYPNGGAVFSVGSIAWIGALAANGYDNPVARITGNVVRRFMAD